MLHFVVGHQYPRSRRNRTVPPSCYLSVRIKRQNGGHVMVELVLLPFEYILTDGSMFFQDVVAEWYI